MCGGLDSVVDVAVTVSRAKVTTQIGRKEVSLIFTKKITKPVAAHHCDDRCPVTLFDFNRIGHCRCDLVCDNNRSFSLHIKMIESVVANLLRKNANFLARWVL